jgi:hypothetical protein
MAATPLSSSSFKAKKKKAQGNHKRLLTEIPLSINQLEKKKQRASLAPIHAEIFNYFRGKLELYSTLQAEKKLILDGSPFLWSLNVWENFWLRVCQNSKITCDENDGCWHAPTKGSYNKARVNNADEYYHVLAWTFENLENFDIINQYKLNAGRNQSHDNKLEIAHRCHNHDCFKAECLIMTSPKANTDMNGCKYGTHHTCPHDTRPPFVKCIFRTRIFIGETFAK